MVTSPAIADRTKNGNVCRMSLHRTRSFLHQTHPNSTTGNITMADLLNSASKNTPSDKPYHRPSPASLNFRDSSVANRPNNIDNVFFCSLIHATVATFTGCNANTRPATHAPGTLSLCSTTP